MSEDTLIQEIASLRLDPRFPLYFGAILPSNDPILMTRGGIAQIALFDEIERDLHVLAVMRKRKMGVTSREWRVDPASDRRRDKQAAELVKRALLRLGMDRLSLALLDAILKGFSVVELIWERQGDRLLPVRFRQRAAHRFVFDAEERLRLLTQKAPVMGILLPERKFIVHRSPAKDDSPYGAGLGSALFWPAFFKKSDLKSWLVFLDKFAQPTPIGEYPPGAPPADQDRLLAVCQAIAEETAVIIPQGMMVRLLEAQRSGSIEAYERFARYLDEQISEAVLGETGTTNQSQGGGSRARDEVGNDVRLELTKADADLLSETLNATLVKWIVELNLPGAEAPLVWRSFEVPEDQNRLAERDRTLTQMGLTPDDAYLADTYPGWQRATPAEPAETPAPPPSFAEAADVDDAYAAQLSERASAPMDALIAPLRALVERAQSMDEIRDGLLEIYPKMAPRELGALMEQALAAAHLAGRYEAGHGR